MWLPLVLLTVIGTGEVIGERVVREVFYTKYPGDDHQSEEKVNYYVQAPLALVPVSPKFLDDHAPAYYRSDMKLTEDVYEGDGLKKSMHDVQESAVKLGKEKVGGHYIVVDTMGKYIYDEGNHDRKSTAEGKILNEHDTSSKHGYGGHGNIRHKIGYKTSGFHKSYCKVESGNDHEFVDDDHTFGKTNDELHGAAGRVKCAEANDEAGYRYSLAGKGQHGSELRTATVHDSKEGDHGRYGSYYERDAVLRNKLAAAYHRGIHDGGHDFGMYEPFY